ncbi:MAG: hypothetical protein IKW89_05960 [Bacteroidales bacterium]|nr:hypothetical protein [Bacteroidales bacterium]
MDILIGILIGAVGMIAFLLWGAWCGFRNQKENGDGKGTPRKQDELNSVDSSELDSGTKVMLGLMGAKLLDNQIEKEKETSEKHRHDSLYWQESIRDKMHEEGLEDR